MRSLIGLMAAAAQEQIPYDALAHANPAIPNSRNVPPDQQLKTLPKFMDAVPAIERNPLLRLTGTTEDQANQPHCSIELPGNRLPHCRPEARGGHGEPILESRMFRLINQLTSQVTVDISKFPLTAIIQQ